MPFLPAVVKSRGMAADKSSKAEPKADPTVVRHWRMTSLGSGLDSVENRMLMRRLLCELGERGTDRWDDHDVVRSVLRHLEFNSFHLAGRAHDLPLMAPGTIRPAESAPPPEPDPAPRPQPRAAPAPAPEQNPTEALENDLQAATLIAAAVTGAPFCEECAKARAGAA